MKKKLVKLNCYICKFDRWFTEKTARQINRGYFPFICDKCAYKMKQQAKEILATTPKWEGITVKC